MTRLGFLGAMNRDIVAELPAADMLQVLGLSAQPLLETAVSDDTARMGARELLARGADAYLGGSAFNAARVAAMLNRDRQLELAFFGIAGELDGAPPHLDALARWGVETTGICRSSVPPATCLAMVESAGRTLLTAIGANNGVVEWLRRGMAPLAQGISRCDAIHVTSYLDEAAPGLMADLLARARQINPGLRVSLDPGMAWLDADGEGLDLLLRQADILHLNSEEFARMGGADAVQDIGRQLRDQWLVVARRHSGVTLYSSAHRDPAAHATADWPLPDPHLVRDATGAGDTFCGAFLWSHVGQGADPRSAAELGFALARAKIERKGPLEPDAQVLSIVESHRAGW